MPSTTDLRWDFAAEEHRVEEHLGRESLFLRRGTAIAEGVSLEHGVFEFDVAFPPGRDFPGGLWRALDHRNYETFFVRPHQSGNPDATQYTPVFNDVFGWQLYHGEPFQVPLELRCDEWLRMRIVFAGGRAEITVGDAPAIVVPLKRPLAAGSVGLLGGTFAGAHFSRFSVEAIEPDAAALAPVDPEPPAPGVIGAWEVSDPVADGGPLDLAGRSWTRLESEPSGLTDLARVNGLEDGRDTAFARAVVHSAAAVSRAAGVRLQRPRARLPERAPPLRRRRLLPVPRLPVPGEHRLVGRAPAPAGGGPERARARGLRGLRRLGRPGAVPRPRRAHLRR